METPGLEVRRRRGHALPGAVGVADFEPMLQTPPLVIDAEDDHEGRRIFGDPNLVRAQVILQVEPDHALAVRMSLPLNLPSHARPFASPCVAHGAVRGCVRGALPGCASPVLAIGGAHLLPVPRLRAGPFDAAQSDRVPIMPSRRLVASAPIRPIVKLPVRSLRRRHLHPSPCRLPSRSEPARCRLLHDFAHTMGRSRLLPRAGLPPPVVIVPLGAAYRSVPSAAMRPTAGPRGGGGADLRVRGGAPLVEPKTRRAEARLPAVLAGLHTRTPRSNPPAPLCPARSRQDCRVVVVSSSTPGLVTFHG